MWFIIKLKFYQKILKRKYFKWKEKLQRIKGIHAKQKLIQVKWIIHSLSKEEEIMLIRGP